MFVPPFSSEKNSLIHEMGREWYNYFSPAAAKSIKKGSRGRRRPGDGDEGNSAFVAPPEAAAAAAAAAGCMSMSSLLHLFDFHHLHFRLHHHQHELHASSLGFDDDDSFSVKGKGSITSRPIYEQKINLFVFLFASVTRSLSTIFDTGVAAPRNSLETSEEIFIDTASSISFTEENIDVSIPASLSCTKNRRDVSKLRVVVPSDSTARSGRGGDEFSSPESSSSPGPRTPNLVARLMGLEVLPDGKSPPNHHIAPAPRLSSTSSQHISPPQRQHSPSPARSSVELPTTRMLSPARSSDVQGRRPSLQISGEKRSFFGEFEPRRLSCSAISTKKDLIDGFDESRKASQFAKQGRRFGVDITNRSENRELRKDEHLMSFKVKKAHKENIKMMTESSPSDNPTPSRSPRLRRIQSKKIETATTDQKELNHQPNAASPSLVPPSASNLRSPDKRTRVTTNKFQPKKAMNLVLDKDELFARRPWRATDYRRAGKTRKEWKKPLLSTSGVLPAMKSAVLPMNKMECSLSISADVPQNQEQQLLKLEAVATMAIDQPVTATPLKARAKATTAPITAATLLSTSSSNRNVTIPTAAITTNSSCSSDAELKYIVNVLNNIGIDADASISLTKWLSPSHPANTSVLNDHEDLYLKCCDTTDASQGHCLRFESNDKLQLALVFEILMDTLRPYANSNPHGWSHIDQVSKSQLAELVSKRVQSLSLDNCRSLKDIDMLVKRDLTQRNHHGWHAFEEDIELIALEIERDLKDSLLKELVSHIGVTN